MGKIPDIPISVDDWTALNARYTSTITGTLPFPGLYPPELPPLGIRGRNLTSNSLVGTTASVPTVNMIALGIAWDDLRGGHTDEDMIIVDGVRLVLRRYFHGDFALVDDRYAGHFRGPKEYLIRKRSSIAPSILANG